MRLALPLLCVAAIALAASGNGQRPIAPDELAMARMEQARTEAEWRRLEAAAAAARGKAQQIASERQAAAMAIEVAEARISTANLTLAREAARLAELKRQLTAAERPARALLAGLATLTQRPPILALFDRDGIDELVRTRLLLRATMPAVRARSAALARQIGAITAQEERTAKSRSGLIAERAELAERQRRLVALEDQAFAAALSAGGAALASGDRVLAGQEAAAEAERGWAVAAELLAEPPAPPRPGAGRQPAASFASGYRLPAEAPVTRGLDEVDRTGIRSRGITLASRRGAPVHVPAAGVLRFAGPFAGHDGVAVIDHGGGWYSLIVNLAVTARPGTRLAAGVPLGRALGPIDVELSRNGQPMSPPIIAGSSEPLFKSR